MKKMAQPFDYGQLAGYGQGGYTEMLDDPRHTQQLLDAPTQTRMPSWALPAGLLAGGLMGVSLLSRGARGLGRGAKSVAQTPGKWMAAAQQPPPIDVAKEMAQRTRMYAAERAATGALKPVARPTSLSPFPKTAASARLIRALHTISKA